MKQLLHELAGITESIKWIKVVYLLCITGQMKDNCSFDVVRAKRSYDAYAVDIFHTNFKMQRTEKKWKEMGSNWLKVNCAKVSLMGTICQNKLYIH